MTTRRPRILRFIPPACLAILAACGDESPGDDGGDVPFFTTEPPATSAGDVPVAASGDGTDEMAADDASPVESSEGAPSVSDLAPSADDAPGGDGNASGGEGAEPPAADGNEPDDMTPPPAEAEAEPVAVPETEPAPATTPQTQVYVLFGQSNMWGVPAPQAQDLEINERVEVLTLQGCGRHGADQWVPAQPPLHGCVGQPGGGGQGPGVGPGDYFGKAMAEAFPEDTILLVPNAIPGVSIDVFQPGQQAYASTLARARMAQQRGEVRGFIFHQGETDTGQGTWPDRVRTVVDRLRSDLGVGDVPFVAGELLYNPIGCCGNGHNPLINQLPSVISNAFVASAEGFGAVPASQDTFGNLHFDLPSQREFGRRYAQAMLTALGR